MIEKTLVATTQLAHNYLRLPMRRHFKARFPQLNANRLREKYATDTWFSTVPSLGGNTAVQFFVGTELTFMKAYGMKKKHNAIAYHRVREAVAAGVIDLVHIPGVTNISDVLTKPLNRSTHVKLLRPVIF